MEMEMMTLDGSLCYRDCEVGSGTCEVGGENV